MEGRMTSEEMDLKIAEAVGWTRIWDPAFRQWTQRSPDGCNVTCDPDPASGWDTSRIPRYSTDLNAMREAEQHLFARNHDARDIFIDCLCRIMDPVSGYRKQSAADIIDATAEQHARAFVETIKSIKP